MCKQKYHSLKVKTVHTLKKKTGLQFSTGQKNMLEAFSIYKYKTVFLIVLNYAVTQTTLVMLPIKVGF
jgi:hypothetical protein